MVMWLLRLVIFLASAAIGLLVASLLLPGFYLHWNDWWGILLAVLIFAILQSILAPLIVRLTTRHAPTLVGGVGLFSTFVALLIAVILPKAGIGIDGPMAWILGTLIVWAVTALATLLLRKLLLAPPPKSGRS